MPKFANPVNNITIPIGREAVFVCVIENLGTYKVKFVEIFILIMVGVITNFLNLFKGSIFTRL